MKKRRVFVGIKASKNLQNEISKWQKLNKNLPVRFIKSQNLHLTLIPPWYSEKIEDEISQISNFKIKKINIIFDKIHINFINKVIWIESSNPPKKIFKIQKDLSSIFKNKEKRKLKVHLTIARFKDGKQLKNSQFEKIDWHEEISKITLFESILGRKEANYKVLH